MKQARRLLINLVQLIAYSLTGCRQAEEALRENEQRFRELFEHSADAIALITCDRIVVGQGTTFAIYFPPALDTATLT